MRVIAGRFRGRSLAAPTGAHTRPTGDRVREALFNVLEHGLGGFSIDGARVLDLFADTGALGIEALSRGAQSCLFVEEDPEARAVIRQNIEALSLTGVTRLWRRDATRLGPAPGRDRFTLVLIDPPYARGLGEKALIAARDGGWLAADTIIVLEERAGVRIDWPQACTPLETRSWGDTDVHFARFAGTSDCQEGQP